MSCNDLPESVLNFGNAAGWLCIFDFLPLAMPGKLQVQVVEARNLPVMDRSAETTDAYVEIHFAGDSYKTDVCAKSLSPHWNSEWFIFEVDEQQLHDDCLQFRFVFMQQFIDSAIPNGMI